MSSRTYRHLPWLGWCFVVLSMLAGGAVAVVLPAVREPAADTVSKAVFGLFLIAVCALFPVGCFRMRTVIDDEAVTQYWITRSFRVPLGEITGAELSDGGHRWFLRVFRGEETYEIIPCMVVFRPGGLVFPRPPRVLAEVDADLTARLGSRR
ncbi:hypothetical protein [Actinoplanes derwentensis]|uniref:PH domain-containing protein n=1 Tax=Actinoplanes derwentensis TaxID=113562 RepID=A0A1H1QBE5_9ACTN|nr:hypothetical protein [Actinoplanes derwentensis]GID82182.1 hypothetical protein Ade03nite_11060 [Actinoplanes derwentensis]SDS20838.1 hypothetical protein SAMN04489716_0259 [Actinoplanes derwentensis]